MESSLRYVSHSRLPLRSLLFSLLLLLAGFQAATAQTTAVSSFTATDNLESGVDLFWEIDEADVDMGTIFEIRVNDALVGVAAASDRTFSHVSNDFFEPKTYCVTVVSGAGVSSSAVCDTGIRVFLVPTDFQASNGTSETGVQLKWTDISAIEQSYELLRDNVPLASLAANTSSYFDNTATPGVTHSYTIFGIEGVTGNENTSTFFATSGMRALIASPADVAATDGLYTDRVELTWTNQASSPDGFIISRGPVEQPLVELETVDADVSSFMDSTATPGTEYTYCVTAFNGNGESIQACDDGKAGELQAPTGVAATIDAFDDRVELDWDYNGPAGIDRFDVLRDNVLIGSASLGSLSFADFDAAPGQDYTYCVQAVAQPDENLPESVSACASDTGRRAHVVPSTDVTASEGDFEDRVEFTWANESTTVMLFKVYRAASSSETPDPGATALIATTPFDQFQYTDRLIAGDTSYDYCVSAVTVTSANAAVQQAVTQYLQTQLSLRTVAPQTEAELTAQALELADGAVAFLTGMSVQGLEESVKVCTQGYRSLNAPTSVAATYDEFETHTQVSWVDESGHENGFRIFRSTDGVTEELAGEVSANRSTFGDYEGVPGMAYTYRVRAFDVYATSPDTLRSESANGKYTVSTDTTGRRTLKPPTQMQASDGESETEVEITWLDNSRGETGYEVLRDGVVISGLLPKNTASYTDTSPAFGTVHTYGVHALDDFGTSTTTEDEGNTDILPPGSVNASDSYASEVVVTWVDRSSIEPGYKVYRDNTVDGQITTGATLLATLAAGTTTYTDVTAGAGTTYEYCVMVDAEAAEPVCDTGRLFMLITGAPGGGLALTEDVLYYDDVPGGPIDGFGWDVEISGNRAIVGAINVYNGTIDEINGENQGLAVVFRREANGWVREAELISNAGQLGGILAIEDEFAFMTSISGFGFDKVFIYKRDGERWSEYDVIDAPSVDVFGVGMDVSDGTLVVGDTMRVHVYELDESSDWTLTQTIEPGRGATIDRQNIGTDGTYIVIGDPNPAGESKALVYRRSGTNWVLDGTLLPDDASSTNGNGLEGQFGETVAIDDGRIVVARSEPDPGAAFVFERIDGTWTQTAKLTPPRLDSWQIAIEGDYIVLNQLSTGSGPSTARGDQYIYRHEDGAWALKESFFTTSNPNNLATGGNFRKVALSGQNLIISGAHAAQGSSGQVSTQTLLVKPEATTASDGLFKDRIQIQWNDTNDGEDGYNIYRREADGTLQKVGSTGTNETTFIDFGAAPGNAYEYCVRAFDTELESAGSPLGESWRTCDIGWRPANGVIAGRVATAQGGGTRDVVVSITPPGNKALLFDGTGGAVPVPASALLNDSTSTKRTIEAWFYVQDKTVNARKQVIWEEGGVGNGLNLYIYDGALYANLWKSNTELTVSTTAIESNRWHHVAMVFDGAAGTFTGYLDGEPSPFTGPDNNASVDTLPAHGNPNAIGAVNGSTQFAGKDDEINNAGEFSNYFAGLIDEVRIWGEARTSAEILEAKDVPLTGDEEGLLAYWPLDQGARRVAPDLTGTASHGTLREGVHWSDQAAPLRVGAVTDLAGNYTIDNIRYDEKTTFTVTPSLENRSFTPAFKTISLATESPVQNEVNFTDDSAFTLAGTVLFAGSECPVPDVNFFAQDRDSGEDGVLKGQSEADGSFAIPVDPSDPNKPLTDLRRLIPQLGDPGDEHNFLLDGVIPTQDYFEFFADGDSTGLLFTDSKVRQLRGFFGGSGPSCTKEIGQAVLKIFTEDGCFSEEFPLTSAGSFTFNLPPQRYLASVEVDPSTIPDGLDVADVLRFYERLGTVEIDLTNEDDTLDVAYRAPLTVTIAGLAAASVDACSAGLTQVDANGQALRTLPIVPILDQGKGVPLLISVSEDYGASGTCPLEGGTLAIFDGIGDVDDAQTFDVVDGQVSYTLTPGAPDVFTGRMVDGVDRSFQKSFTAVAQVDGREDEVVTEWAVVEGARPRIGTFVTAASDPIPLWILHDPPGEESFSFIEKGSTVCATWSYDNAYLISEETGVQTKVGFEALTGTAFGGLFAVKTEAIGGVNVTFEAGGGGVFENAESVCMTNEERIETSTNQVYAGPIGDVFVGVGLNFLFAEADNVDVTSSSGVCELNLSESLAGGLDLDDPIATTYHYTRGHIEGALRAQTENLIENLGGTMTSCQGATDKKACRQLLNGMETWDNLLAYDSTLQAPGAFEVIENVSYEAGAVVAKSYTYEETDEDRNGSQAIVNFSLEKSFKVGTATFGSLVSLAGKFDFSSQTLFGRDTTTTFTVGYELEDDDAGDYFTVDVGRGIAALPDCELGDFFLENHLCEEEQAVRQRDFLPGSELIFKVRSGRSSSPWEPWYDATGTPRTQPRDRAKLEINPPIRDGVPPDDPATFTVSMTNAGDSQEIREYVLRAIHNSNPGGAVLSANGATLHEGLSFFIGPQQTQEVTLAVERGPNRYQYDDLKVQMYPAVEYPIWEDGGVGGSGILQLADTVRFSVGFAPPCSDVGLLLPKERWALNTEVGTLGFVFENFTLFPSATDSVSSIQLQYRRLELTPGGDFLGGWRTGVTVPHDSLVGLSSYAGQWTPDVQDGHYEIRAVTTCQAGQVSSDFVSGVIDRQAPRVLGTPMPADEVLALGDDILVQFDEPIDCATVDSDASGSGAVNAQLAYVDGPNAGTTIADLQTVCSEDRIVISPPASYDWADAEGLQLEARLRTDMVDAGGDPVVIRDPAGNPLPSELAWRFAVRRSAFLWDPANLEAAVQEGTTNIVSAELVNGKQIPVSFTLPTSVALTGVDTTGAPTGSDITLSVLSTGGELVPGGRRAIELEVPDTAPLGTYEGTLEAMTPDGAAKLYLAVDVLSQVCTPPAWAASPQGFAYSMTLTGSLSFGGVISDDADDMLAAFVGNQIRGAGHVTAVGPGTNRVYLTIYSTIPAGETVTFRAYDADACLSYPSTNQVLAFQNDTAQGTPGQPLSVNATLTAPALQTIPLAQGWTWFSINRVPADPSIDLVLPLTAQDGDLVKTIDETNFFDVATRTWSALGKLEEITPGMGYQIKLQAANAVVLGGAEANAPSTPISIDKGWTWIGYLPQGATSVDAALASLSPAVGDQVKSQFAFAQWDGSQWVGSLVELKPGQGYLINSNKAGTLTYPAVPQAGAKQGAQYAAMRMDQSGALSTRSGFTAHSGGDSEALLEALSAAGIADEVAAFDATRYRSNMTLTASLTFDGLEVTDERALVWAESDGEAGSELRGLGQLEYVDSEQGYRLFLMLYGDETDLDGHGTGEGEELTLSIYEPTTGQVFVHEETVAFQVNAAFGTLAQPIVLAAQTDAYKEAQRLAALPKQFALQQNYPNPFNPRTTIHYELPEQAHVQLVVFDILGRAVMTLVDEQVEAGRYDVVFDARSLASGAYFYRIKAGSFNKVYQMMLIK